MSNFRIRYGLAFGPEGSVGLNSANHLLPPQDGTPDVTLGTFFVTANTSAVSYSYFDITGSGGIDPTAKNNGKQIFILFQDNNTTVANGANIFLSNTLGAFTSGAVLGLVHYNSSWYEDYRSENTRDSVKTVTVAGATLAPNVTGARILIVNNTAASTVVGLSGGTVGQELYVVKDVASAGTSLTIQGAANLMLAGTTAFVMNDSASYLFVSDAGSRFRQVGGPITP